MSGDTFALVVEMVDTKASFPQIQKRGLSPCAWYCEVDTAIPSVEGVVVVGTPPVPHPAS